MHLYQVMCRREELLQEFRPNEPKDLRRLAFSKRYFQEVRIGLHRRRPFLSSIGSLRVGPESIQEGDFAMHLSRGRDTVCAEERY